MTKKHFIAFAKLIKQRVDEAGEDHELLMRAEAIYLAVVAVQDSPKFNRIKFYKACGLKY